MKSKEEVIEMLKDEFSTNRVTSPSRPSPQTTPVQNTKIKASFFAKFAHQQKQNEPVEEEVEEYLNVSRQGEADDPLVFWKKNSSRFPTLSLLAKQYLAFPATSGSVERLFSVAGAIMRARRAKITAANMERMLCCREKLKITQILTAEEDDGNILDTSQSSQSSQQSEENNELTMSDLEDEESEEEET